MVLQENLGLLHKISWGTHLLKMVWPLDQTHVTLDEKILRLPLTLTQQVSRSGAPSHTSPPRALDPFQLVFHTSNSQLEQESGIPLWELTSSTVRRLLFWASCDRGTLVGRALLVTRGRSWLGSSRTLDRHYLLQRGLWARAADTLGERRWCGPHQCLMSEEVSADFEVYTELVHLKLSPGNRNQTPFSFLSKSVGGTGTEKKQESQRDYYCPIPGDLPEGHAYFHSSKYSRMYSQTSQTGREKERVYCIILTITWWLNFKDSFHSNTHHLWLGLSATPSCPAFLHVFSHLSQAVLWKWQILSCHWSA